MCRAGFNQVGNRLGLRQVELVVEKRTLAELTRPRQAAAQLQAALQQHVQDDWATVPLQLQHILTGE
ncbi:hypothetical protein D3C87_2154530 [compost metagenome]